MAEHESCLGASDDWYTPKSVFDALGEALRGCGLGWFVDQRIAEVAA